MNFFKFIVHFRQLRYQKLDDLDEIDKFLGRYKLLKLTKEITTLNIHVSS